MQITGDNLLRSQGGPDEQRAAPRSPDFQNTSRFKRLNFLGQAQNLVRNLERSYFVEAATTKLHCPIHSFLQRTRCDVIFLQSLEGLATIKRGANLAAQIDQDVAHDYEQSRSRFLYRCQPAANLFQ